MFWGLSSSLDLLETYLQENTSLPTELNILLVGGSDSRHILQTLARRYRHATTTINFLVAEASVETIARQLLLLCVAFQDTSVMGLVPKVKLFMELYGNTLVRPSVAKFLTTVASDLVKMVTDYDYLKEVMPCVTLALKYKERDYLENVVKFWCGRADFDICDSWDKRLRKTLGGRYDSKLGAFDWDLHMRLHTIGGKQICGQEYRNFRLTGVAFNWLESEVSKPNRSLVCVVVPDGDRFLHYGYLGDQQTGPFVTYGLNCEDSNFLQATNGQNLYRATDVTERNLCQMFHEIQHGTRYLHQSTSDFKLGPVVMNLGEKRVVDVRPSDGGSKKIECFRVENVTIKFVSLSVLPLMEYKSEYREFFDLVYFGCFYVKHLRKEWVNQVVKPGGVVLVENQKFVVSHREKQLHEFAAEVGEALGGAEVRGGKFDPCNDDFAKYVKVK